MKIYKESVKYRMIFMGFSKCINESLYCKANLNASRSLHAPQSARTTTICYNYIPLGVIVFAKALFMEAERKTLRPR